MEIKKLNNMFIYSEWDRICKDLSENYNCILANQILQQDDNKNWVVVKHDVETNVSKALIMAKIEDKYDIKATYYVQSSLLKDNKNILKQISDLGHELTYHYDVLDANNGNYENAISEFRETLTIFKDMNCEVQTVCPHGNPILIREGWSSNKDFFRKQEVSELFPNILDIVVHLPLKLKKDYLYISDASYGWKKISNVQDNDIFNSGDEVIVNLLDSLNQSNECIVISTHPHRWQSSRIKILIKIFLFQNVRFFARFLSKIPFFKKIMSKYYYLAKNI